MRKRPHQFVTRRALGPDERVHAWTEKYSLCTNHETKTAKGGEPDPSAPLCLGCVMEDY